MKYIINLSITLLFASGLYIILSDSWSQIYKLNLFFHPIIGQLSILGVIWYYYGKFKKFVKNEKKKRPAAWKLLPAGFILILVVNLLIFKNGYLLWPITIFTLISLGYFTKTNPVFLKDKNTKAIFLSGQSLFLLLLLSLLTGIPMAFVWAGPRSIYLIYSHRLIGFLTIFAFIIHLFIYSLIRLFDKNYSLPPDYLPNIKRNILMSVSVLLLIFMFIAVWDLRGERVRYTVELDAIPAKEPPPPQKGPPMSYNAAELLSISKGCGTTKGCHISILDDFNHSAHNLAIQTPYFQKNLDLLVEEMYSEAVENCMACHVPIAMFFNSLDYEYYKDHDNSSCAFCHSISSVKLYPHPGRSSYTVEPNLNHLRMFSNLDEKGEVSKTTSYMIFLNPLGHGRAFSRALYKEDRYCQACHHLQLKTPKEVGLLRPTCNDCHMQNQEFLRGNGDKMNHFFPGTNTAIPYIKKNDEILKMVRRWVKGDVRLDASKSVFWELRESSDDVANKSFWLFMVVEPLNRPMPGKIFKFRVITSNVGMEHPFPSSVVELIEVWLEVILHDSNKNPIFHCGYLDEEFKIDPKAPKLGGYMLDEEGNIIDRNRVWAMKKKVIERVIKAGVHIHDDFSVHIPDNVGDEISITARWNYRKLNQEFINWAYEGQRITMPVTEVGSVEARLEIKR